MKVIFIFFLRLKWKYVKIMEVQEVSMEVQEESVSNKVWKMKERGFCV